MTESHNPELEAKLVRLKTTYVDSELNWYKKHEWAPLVSYRLAGVLILVLGALLPAATIFKDSPWYPSFVTAAGAVIVVATGLEGFFQWRLNWQSRCHAERELSRAVAEWEIALTEASAETDRTRRDDARIDEPSGLGRRRPAGTLT